MFHLKSRSIAAYLLGVFTGAMILGIPQLATAADAGKAGDTKVAQWKDNKKASFLMLFDDNAPSHLKNVIPELKKRNFTGTFYVCPGKGWTDAWKKEVPATGMEYGNHTFTHSGAKDAAKLDEEIKLCSEAIDKAYPDRKTPRLVSWGKPGTGKGTWLVSKEEEKEALLKYNLVDRGPFKGAAIHYKTGKDLVAVAEKALADGSTGYIVFHGVGGDWLAASMPDFLQLLDYLSSKQDQIWVTDHISSHKYETERNGAEVKVMEATDKKIQLSLTAKINPKFHDIDGKEYTSDKIDPKLYDAPLTLITQVPAGWQKCQIAQGSRKTTATAANGVLQYEVLPNADPISIQPATP